MDPNSLFISDSGRLGFSTGGHAQRLNHKAWGDVTLEKTLLILSAAHAAQNTLVSHEEHALLADIVRNERTIFNAQIERMLRQKNPIAELEKVLQAGRGGLIGDVGYITSSVDLNVFRDLFFSSPENYPEKFIASAGKGVENFLSLRSFLDGLSMLGHYDALDSPVDLVRYDSRYRATVMQDMERSDILRHTIAKCFPKILENLAGTISAKEQGAIMPVAEEIRLSLYRYLVQAHGNDVAGSLRSVQHPIVVSKNFSTTLDSINLRSFTAAGRVLLENKFPNPDGTLPRSVTRALAYMAESLFSEWGITLFPQRSDVLAAYHLSFYDRNGEGQLIPSRNAWKENILATDPRTVTVYEMITKKASASQLCINNVCGLPDIADSFRTEVSDRHPLAITKETAQKLKNLSNSPADYRTTGGLELLQQIALLHTMSITLHMAVSVREPKLSSDSSFVSGLGRSALEVLESTALLVSQPFQTQRNRALQVALLNEALHP